jgi:hypothetical protein
VPPHRRPLASIDAHHAANLPHNRGKMTNGLVDANAEGGSRWGLQLGRFRFDLTVSVGNVLTVMLVVGAIVSSWYRFDSRLTVNEMAITQLQRQQADTIEIQKKTNETLYDLNFTLGKLEQRLKDEDEFRTRQMASH